MPSRLQIFRIEKESHLADAFNGEGARLWGGRWNSPGLPAIYCSLSLSLALLEILVHAGTLEERADPRVWFSISLPRAAALAITARSLPASWNAPALNPATAALGDAWLRGNRSVALRVPSVLLPGEWNYLLNPGHPAFRKQVVWSKPQRLEIDPRIPTPPGLATP